MTDHKIGTRDEWLAARLKVLNEEKELTRRGDELARRRRELPWVRIDKEYQLETDEGSASLAGLSLEGARSFSSTTSCSGPTSRRAVHPARRSRTDSMASSSTWRTTTSRFRPCRGHCSRSCRHTSNGWAGRLPGRLRQRLQFRFPTSRSPRSSSAMEPNTTSAATPP